jgi:predicted dehydrogenase
VSRGRYAVIGLGHITQVAVLPAFAHARNSELTALVSGDPEKLESLGRRYEVAHRFAYTMTVGERTTRRRGRKHDQFAAELIHFSTCVLRSETPEPSGRDGAWDVRIVDDILESARRGETIAVRPFDEPWPRPRQATALPPTTKPDVVNAPEPHD